MTKAELMLENDKLREDLAQLNAAYRISISQGLEYQRRFNNAYMMLSKITGLNNHVVWLEIQDYLKTYNVIHHPVYGKMAVLK